MDPFSITLLMIGFACVIVGIVMATLKFAQKDKLFFKIAGLITVIAGVVYVFLAFH